MFRYVGFAGLESGLNLHQGGLRFLTLKKSQRFCLEESQSEFGIQVVLNRFECRHFFVRLLRHSPSVPFDLKNIMQK